jgi:hypothetical protein
LKFGREGAYQGCIDGALQIEGQQCLQIISVSGTFVYFCHKNIVKSITRRIISCNIITIVEIYRFQEISTVLIASSGSKQ